MLAISFPQKLHPEGYKYLSDGCARAGLWPNVTQEVTTFPEALPLVAKGEGFTFSRKCFIPFSCPGVAFRPIKGNPLTVETGFVYLKNRKSAQVDAFLTALARLRSLIVELDGIRTVAA